MIVTTPTSTTGELTSSRPRATSMSVSCTGSPTGMSMPKKCRSWLAPMWMAAPAVKPTITEWEMKFTRNPKRASPSTSSKMPTIKVRVRASRM